MQSPCAQREGFVGLRFGPQTRADASEALDRLPCTGLLFSYAPTKPPRGPEEDTTNTRANTSKSMLRSSFMITVRSRLRSVSV